MGSRAGNRPWLRQWPSLRVMKSETESGLACSAHHRGTTMDHYAGIDVSLESASICVVDASGRIVRCPRVLLARRVRLRNGIVAPGHGAGPRSRDNGRPHRTTIVGVHLVYARNAREQLINRRVLD